VALGGSIPLAYADAPPFDRPGIAFSTDTIAAGRFIVEQGAPDVVRSARSDDAETTYALGTRLRTGLTDSIEAQIAVTAFARLEGERAGRSYSADGHGDSSFALKAALPGSGSRVSWAALAAVTLANGSERFTNDDAAYDLGTTVGYAFDDDVDAYVFVDVERSGGRTSLQISPSIDFQLSPSLGAFVEAGATLASDTDTLVAGGGVMWLVTRSIQLDVSADFGLTDDSPTLQAGFGISVFF
jgi:hypothetical protein